MVARIRWTVVGTLPGAEDFAFGWDTTATSVPDQATLTGFLPTVHDLLLATLLGPDVRVNFSGNTAFTGLRAYRYGSGTGQADAQAYQSISGINGGRGDQLPNQLAICVTTKAERPGRSYRGRMYLPCITASSLTGAGEITQPVCDSIATGVHDFFTGFDGLDIVEEPSIWSAKKQVLTRIQNIAVDSRIDIQRRRASREPAVYTAGRTIYGPGS